jgi:hypothetical protein
MSEVTRGKIIFAKMCLLYRDEHGPLELSDTNASAAMSCAKLASNTSPLTSPNIGVLVTKSRSKPKTQAKRRRLQKVHINTDSDSDSDDPSPKAAKTVVMKRSKSTIPNQKPNQTAKETPVPISTPDPAETLELRLRCL